MHKSLVQIGKFIVPLSRFSTKKTEYKPLIPLTEEYNMIFTQTTFSSGKLIKTYPLPVYMIPAGLIAINNYLISNSWQMYNSIGFGLFVLLGLGAKFMMKSVNSAVCQCLMIDNKAQRIILCLQKGLASQRYEKLYGVHGKQLHQIRNSYHPLKLKHPSLKIVTDLMQFEKAGLEYKLFRDMVNFENQVVRLSIPLQQISVQFFLKEDLRLTYSRDLQRLEPKEMMKKYENYPIRISLKSQPKLYEKLVILTEKNQNKKMHDYLLALVLGYKIDTSENKVLKTRKSQEIKYD